MRLRRRTVVCTVLPAMLAGIARPASAAEADVAAALGRAVIEADLPLEEVRRFTESRVPLMPKAATAEEWDRIAARLRHRVLDEVVFRGEATRWRDADTRVEWLDRIPGGPGYHLRKLRYEALPGLWIPAILYEPDHLDAKVPATLNVNGHEARGKAVPYKQLRCINLVKRGMLALNVEWFGMGQLKTENFTHYRMNQIDLCGTSGIAPFYLAMKRALDVLLAHPHADPDRVAVAGLSGGGWQTIFISSLDTRVTLANPVAGYSSFRTRARFVSDLGDSEQTPVDLATVADYVHLTAMRAPRPTLLTYNTRDDCCFRADHALQPLLDGALPVFKLYGRADHLRSHINDDPGTHNFEKDNREAYYRMLGEFLTDDPAAFDSKEMPSEAEVKSADELLVPLPADNADFHTLALKLSERLPRASASPTAENAGEWRKTRREALRELVRERQYPVKAEAAARQRTGALAITHWRLKLGDDWTVPATELAPGNSASLAMLIADAGRKSAGDTVSRLLSGGHRVLAMDPFYFGESHISQRDHLFALLVSGVGERPLGIQAGQVASIARWLRARYPKGPIMLAALGPRTGVVATIAAALEDKAIDRLEVFETLPSLKALIERNWTVERCPELFCFGLLEQFDVKNILALAAPRDAVLHEAAPSPVTTGPASQPKSE